MCGSSPLFLCGGWPALGGVGVVGVSGWPPLLVSRLGGGVRGLVGLLFEICIVDANIFMFVL